MGECLYKGIDYTDRTVGCYRIIGYSHFNILKSGIKRHHWTVECVHCGNIKTLDMYKAVGKYQDGCQQCVRVRFAADKSFNWRNSDIKNVTGWYFRSIQHSAINRKLDFSLTREHLEQKFVEQDGKCIYTRIELYFGNGHKRGTASVDRINSKLGYIEGNIQWVHKDVNTMKLDLTHEEFINFCKLVTENCK